MFNEFSAKDATDWLEKIAQELQEKSVESLVWENQNGFLLQPFYTQKDTESLKTLPQRVGEPPYLRTNSHLSNTWQVACQVPERTAAAANKTAIDALANGASALMFELVPENQRSFNGLFKGILPQHIGFFLATSDVLSTINFLEKFLKKEKIDPTTVRGSLMFNPLQNKKSYNNTNLALEDAGVSLASLKNSLPNCKLFYINSVATEQTAAQELAELLHTANQYLHYLTETDGWEIDEIAPHFTFEMRLSSDFYEQTAKLRAFRLLWANLIDAYKPQDLCSKACFVLARTSVQTTTETAVETNILRNTTQGISAVLGGANALLVQAHSPENRRFSGRIARNIQLILQHESYLDQVADPTAGSYFLEIFTQKMADAAWKTFQKM